MVEGYAFWDEKNIKLVEEGIQQCSGICDRKWYFGQEHYAPRLPQNTLLQDIHKRDAKRYCYVNETLQIVS